MNPFFPNVFCRTPLQNRQLDGAMHRVPPGFYDKGAFYILMILLTDIKGKFGKLHLEISITDTMKKNVLFHFKTVQKVLGGARECSV